MNPVVAVAYVIFGGIVGTLTCWNYVLWCVKRSKKIIDDNKHTYSAEEIQVIENFVDDCLNIPYFVHKSNSP